MKLIRHPVRGGVGEKIHSFPQPCPHILCGFVLTPHLARATIPRICCFRSSLGLLACAATGGAHAIPAGLDRSVHQSGLRRSRPLVARAPLRAQRRLGILPFLRQLAASGASADRSAPAYEAAPAHRASAASSTPSLARNFPATAPQNKKTGETALRSFNFLGAIPSVIRRLSPFVASLHRSATSRGC
jgi:hypothetical protein